MIRFPSFRSVLFSLPADCIIGAVASADLRAAFLGLLSWGIDGIMIQFAVFPGCHLDPPAVAIIAAVGSGHLRAALAGNTVTVLQYVGPPQKVTDVTLLTGVSKAV
jgi:hypothetical protein